MILITRAVQRLYETLIVLELMSNDDILCDIFSLQMVGTKESPGALRIFLGLLIPSSSSGGMNIPMF